MKKKGKVLPQLSFPIYTRYPHYSSPPRNQYHHEHASRPFPPHIRGFNRSNIIHPKQWVVVLLPTIHLDDSLRVNNEGLSAGS